LAPSLYLGMFQKQLYVQESNSLQILVQKQLRTHQNLITDETNYPRIPWKPFPASSNALTKQSEEYIVDGAENQSRDKETFDLVKYDDSSTSLSVLYATEYVNGNGFYLYSSEDFQNRTKSLYCEKKGKSTDHSLSETEDFTIFQNESVKYVVLGLWYYWKEVLVIALTTAFVVNLFVHNRIPGEREVVFVDREVVVPVPMGKDALEFEEEQQEAEKLRIEKVRSLSESASPLTPEYISRFITDFDLVRRLGKGGFGVVFEAKNKLDDCNYAVKRIPLPKKKESRDRVMREVKTLANCEHKNIVRYFQAWIEQPPPGWQEEKDKELFAKDFLSTSITIESPSPTETESKPFLQIPKEQRKDKTDLLKNVLKKTGHPFEPFNFEPTFNSSIDESSDSYIQFKAPSTRDDDSDDGIVFKDPTRDGETEDSFQIEFKNSTNGELAISIEKNTEEQDIEKSSSPENRRPIRKRERPLSLDLSSCGEFKKNIQQNVANSKLRVYLFIQMQLCQKECLRDWLRITDLEARKNKPIDIFDQIVSAVHYVHMKGLIHRDLKPSNIFFSLDGQVKIGDFGLVTDMADISDDSGSSSSSNFELENSGDCYHKKHTNAVGTHLYMSPEQLQHQAYNYKVDIYSLGLILFELLVFFATETERVVVLTGLKNHKFSEHFQKSFFDEVSFSLHFI
jgi:translation initiation factor 2-alpha kinase 3